MQEPGRNDPCPCGSGRKYKKCCLLKTQSTHVTEKTIQDRLIRDILAFSQKYYRYTVKEAYEFFWEEFDPNELLGKDLEDMADINFWEWFVYDWQPDVDNDMTLLELFVEKSRDLSTGERNVLQKMNEAVLSLYEVQEVLPEEGLILKDLLLGEEYTVREKSATRFLSRWDILAARILHLDGNYIMSGSVYTYPTTDKNSIINYFKQCFKDYRKGWPKCTMREFLKEEGDAFNYYWYERIRDPARPILMTTTGESLVFSTATFDIRDRRRVVERLNQMDELDKLEEGVYKWLDEEKDDDSATVFGTIEIQENVLSLVCQSRERHERGKLFLQERLGESIIHKIDTFQDPWEAVESLPQTAQLPESGMSKEMEQELYTEYMQQHYENWLDEKIPALKGKTPLDTVKKPWGKKKVAELLKSIENMEEHKKKNGELWFDIQWMWDRLGIER